MLLLLYSPVVTISTAGLTFGNSTFCPHSVFVCFAWFSEQTAIISIYSINWLLCITETECVYCAVRTECCIIQVYFRPSDTLSTTNLTRTSSNSRNFMWDLWCTKWHWDKSPPHWYGFHLSLSFLRWSTLIFICMLLLPDGQTSEAWGPSHSSALSEIGKHRVAKYFRFIHV